MNMRLYRSVRLRQSAPTSQKRECKIRFMIKDECRTWTSRWCFTLADFTALQTKLNHDRRNIAIAIDDQTNTLETA